MSKFLPIYIDSSNVQEHVCHTCDSSSRDQPIHCITVSSPAPPPYSRNYSPVPPPKDSAPRNLAVPILNLETSRCWTQSRPRPPRPALRFDIQANAGGGPRVRSRRSNFSPLSPATTIHDVDFERKSYCSGSSIPNTPVDDDEYTTSSKAGLGIPEAPFNPDPSPTRSPGSERLATAEKGQLPKKKSSSNLAEGIEQRLWKYSASSNVVKRWLLEIISWLLSALCMTAIIIVLFVYKDKPVPTNWLMGLTLNAYIAILSRVASAGLLLPASEAIGQLKWSWFQGHSKKMWDFELFDNASRGPWGSLLLLVRTKGKTLAALGAAITIFALALDPFFQQVVHYPTRWNIHPQNSSIPKVTHLELPTILITKGNESNSETNLDLAAAAQKFFFDHGVPSIPFGNGTRAEIPIACPTSNCTWEPYETMGVCSKCADVADMLEFGCHTATLDWVESATSWLPYKNGTMCGWFFNITSSSRMLMAGYQVDPATNRSSGEILTTRLLPLITNINRKPLFGTSINFKNVRNPITDFVVVTAANGSDHESMLRSILRNEKPRAHECMLSWCVQTIESSYFMAAYTETVKTRFINTTIGPYPWHSRPVPDPNGGPDPWIQVTYEQNIEIDPHARDGHANVTTYGLSNQTAFQVLKIFDELLPAFVTSKSNRSDTLMKYNTKETIPLKRQYRSNSWASPTNVTQHMERLATTMTNVIRMGSSENVSGKAYSDETFVEVRWAWLSLPMGLLGFTLIFLLATIIRTSMEMDRVGVWKNSSIAMLLYGLPDALQQKITASEVKGTPRAQAKELNVRMLPTKGWRISGNLFSPVTRKSKSEPPAGFF